MNKSLLKNKRIKNLTFSQKNAFTLAEVLITLGIIGVVAAMTLPTLIQNHKKHVVEVRLAKFYSIINQAVTRSEVDNGDYKFWDELGKECQWNEEIQACMEGSIKALQWYNKYLAEYLNVVKVGTKSYGQGVSNKVILHFSDGSLFEFNKSAGTFFVNASDYPKCIDENSKKCLGTKSFTFYFNQDGKRAFEPFQSGMDVQYLLDDSEYGCNHTANNKYTNCAAVIQANNWKIPKDYPLKF